MKRVLTIISIVLVVSVLSLFIQPSYNTMQDRYKHIAPSVVRVNNWQYESKDIKKQTPSNLKLYGLGTGEFVSNHYILTAYHVIANQKGITIDIDNTHYTGEVIAGNKLRDWALIYIKDIVGEPVLFGNSNNLQVGDTVFKIGEVWGLKRVLGEGFISALTYKPFDNLPFLQSFTQVREGDSGSGLYTEDCKLIGVIVAGIKRDGQMGFFDLSIPIDEIKEDIYKAIRLHKKLLKG